MPTLVTRCMRPLFVALVACALAFTAVQVAQAQAQPDGASPAAPAANPVVNVAHFAPFGANVLSTSVTVRINGIDRFTNFVYGDIITGVNVLSAGRYTIEILPTGSTAVAISGVVTLTEDTQYTLAAIGDGSNQPLALAALVDETTAPPAGSAKLRIAHFAPFAATLAATRVDICDDATGAVLPGLAAVPFGAVAPYPVVPAGVYDLSIAVAGTNCATVALDLPAIAAVAGKIYDVYAIGKNNTAFPLEIASVTGLDAPAQVTVGHFAPFATTITGTLVDIRVNGTVAFTQVAYGNFVSGVKLPPGSTLVEVLPSGSSTVALSATLPLSGGAKYNLFAIGGANTQPLAFSTAQISTTAPAGKALFTVGHLAPFAANVDSTAVDICTDAGAPVLTNVKYPDVAANLPFDPGLYNLKITVAGTNCATTALDLPAFRLTAGDISDAFAIGDRLSGEPFGLEVVTITGLRPAWEQFLPFTAKR